MLMNNYTTKLLNLEDVTLSDFACQHDVSTKEIGIR